MAQLGSALPAFKTAFVTAATTLFEGEDVEVVRNRRKFEIFQNGIVVGTGSSESNPATLSATQRTRDELIQLEVTIYCYVPGGEESEDLADEGAYSMLNKLEEYCRVTDTSFGNTVQYCYLTAHVAGQATDDTVISRGRMCVIVATFSAKARITS